VGWSLAEKKQPRIRGNGEEMGDLPPTVGHFSEKIMMILWILGVPFFSDRAIWFVSSAGTTERCTLNKSGHYKHSHY
jgi:hypothetical protein